MNVFVYILANHRRGTLYTGVTSNLAQRLAQHSLGSTQGFSSRYDVTRLVWYAQGHDIAAAIALEKKIKNRSRPWKIALIEKENPGWNDLATEPTVRLPKDTIVIPPTFRLADPVADRSTLIAMNVEYVTWVFAEIEAAFGPSARDILGVEVADYIPTVIDKVCGDPPPRGAFYLVESDGQAIAMGGLRHSEDGIAELKRVYVRSAGRGLRLGEAIARRLVDDARAFGYRQVRLDTLPFMHTAQALYETMGFADCPPYPVEMPQAARRHLRYMALTL